MAKKLSEEELDNVSGGACKPVLISHKLVIYFYNNNGKKQKHKEFIKLWNNTKKDESGRDCATIAKEWCIANGYTYIEFRLDQGEY